MTDIKYEDLFDENGRRAEWYDEDFPSDISVGCNYAYDDEFSVNDELDVSDETFDDMVKRHSESLERNLEYQEYRAVCVASYMTELVEICLDMNSCLNDFVMVSLIVRVYNLLYYVHEKDLLSVYDVLEKNYLDFAYSNALFERMEVSL